MKSTSTLIKPVFLAATLIASGPGSSETIAAWTPSGDDGPRGTAYYGSGNIVGADLTSAGILWTSAARVGGGGGTNSGAVWPGSTNTLGFSPDVYTSFSLEVAEGSTLQVNSLTYFMNFYGTDRQTTGDGTVVNSTIQGVLRSSVDDFAEDLATFTSLPEDRPESFDYPFVFDVSQVAELQAVTEPIEFRVYFWEESTVEAFDPFFWTDLATGGCIIDGTVVSSVNREVLAAWIPTAAPVDGAANATNIGPSKIILSPAVGSAFAENVGKGGGTNAAAVWPGSVNSFGFDEFSYLETTLTPAPGSTITVTDYIVNAINTYGTTGPDGWAAVLRASTDSFTEDIGMTSGIDTFEVAFDLSNVASLRNLTGPVSFRLYLWDVEPADSVGFEPFMWTDIVGSTFSESSGIQIIGTNGIGSFEPPLIVGTEMIPGTGFQVEVVNVIPGKTYELLIAFDLADPFEPLDVFETATGGTVTLLDGFANTDTDPKAFYQVREAVTQ